MRVFRHHRRGRLTSHMLRLVQLAATLCISSVATASLAQPPRQMDFGGSWTFTWDNNPRNMNLGDLKQGTGTFTGTYVNDAKDKCPLVGRMSSPTAVTLTIVCPLWEIRADGSITNSQLVVGSYVAYGSSRGTFQMSRK